MQNTKQKPKETKKPKIPLVPFYDDICHKENFSLIQDFENLNLKIKKGENIAILGSTGSGKTSLVNLIPRFYDVSEGSLKINGIDVRDLDLDSLRSKISICMQKTELFSGTVNSNIRWGNENAEESEIVTASDIAEAREFIEKYA